jgi:hypothetical protein
MQPQQMSRWAKTGSGHCGEERAASFRPQVLSRVQALRSDYPGLGSSEGHPGEIIQSSCMAALTLYLAGVALADDLQTVGNSDSLGFSAWRLEQITSWFEAQHLPRFVPLRNHPPTRHRLRQGRMSEPTRFWPQQWHSEYVRSWAPAV